MDNSVSKITLSDLIGQEIEDIRVKIEYESHGLDKGDAFIFLKGNLSIGIPWSIDPEEFIYERTDSEGASSIFQEMSDEMSGLFKGRKIVAILCYEERQENCMEAEKAFLELEEETFVTEITIAPNGTGLVGVWLFKSRAELEQRYGTNYKRLDSALSP